MPKPELSDPITLRLPVDVLDAIERIGRASDRTRSWVMVRALRLYLAGEGADILAIAKGLEQIEREGAVQVLWDRDGSRNAPVLAAIGELQFEVAIRRLADEYGVETILDHLIHTTLRLVRSAPPETRWPSDAMRLVDRDGGEAILFRSPRDVQHLMDRSSGVELGAISDIPTADAPEVAVEA